MNTRPSRAAIALSALLLSAGSAIPLLLAAGAIAASPAQPQPQPQPQPRPQLDSQPAAAMLRYPDISATQIVFAYANDLWAAPRSGGAAQPLASPPGAESFPRFSPDGQTIAFVGNYEGNRDLYTIPAVGGLATRVTHHPAAETLSDWSPDGSRLVFFTNGFAGLARQSQLFTTPAAGGLPEKMPMPYAGFGAISRDGEWVAFTPHSVDNRTWKRYRGGMATDIWLLNLKTSESKRITDWEGVDTLPMWGYGPASAIVVYLSDAGPEHRMNLWSYDTTSGVRSQITTFSADDVRWPSIGPGPGGQEAPWGEVIFQLGSSLRVLDLATKQTREVKITIPGDRPKLMPRDEDASKTNQGWTISPTGKRVLSVGRGDIFSLPVKEGVVRNLTRSDSVFDRDPSWSPDGRWIAFFSDRDGEYDLWLLPADARPPEDKKSDDDKDPKDAPAPPTSPAAEPDGPAKTGPIKIAALGPGFRYAPTWSPDSKRLAFTDKAGEIFLATLKFDGPTVSGEVRSIDKDPVSVPPAVSWSSDSNWIAYLKGDPGNSQNGVWLYDIKADAKTQVVSSMFNCGGVAFDRKGDWLFLYSSRSFNPVYSDLDTTFAYTGGETLLMVPLREDVKHPFAPISDEEEYKKDDKPKPDADKAKANDKANDKAGDGAKADEKKDTPPKDAAKADDGLSGSWEAKATGGNLPPEGLAFTLTLRLAGDGAVSGTISSIMGVGPLSGTFDKGSGLLTFSGSAGGAAFSMSGTIKNGEGSGTWRSGQEEGAWSGKRSSGASGDAKQDDPDAKDAKDKDSKNTKDAKPAKVKDLKIDLDGLERRAIPLPVPPGNFGDLAVTDDGKLIYVRSTSRGVPGEPSIKIFDPKDDAKEEKTVTSGASFEMSGDGKKLLVRRGGSAVVVDAAAGGGKAQNVSTSGMTVRIRPREEWRQIFTEVFRLHRDFFYEPTLHHVDWPRLRDHYGRMIDDCVSREDVTYVISEFISELNIGHAYVTNPGDIESGPPSVNVGLLGCDFTLDTSGASPAYRISAIYEGAPWDSDARGPLSQPGEKKNRVSVGDFVLAVNGLPIDTAGDPWAAFRGLADKPVTLTVSSKSTIDAAAREVLIKPVASEVTLRYRAWIDRNRRLVSEKSGGQIGYIYVPNTGVDGQTDLFRQFFGQRDKAALIIDERWNGGGQIPTRFIELLNRPVTNYWARRDGKDWTWPPDSHQGPKAMLVNGLAGSGGDMFPWLFKHNKLGKVIGSRTWGGLVGISGNPGLIDGGAISVPTFGFYKKDGTWGVEGHGVDPDIEVIDDPGKMTSGGDPQLEFAITHLLEEIQKNGYAPPARPASPDRSGMGIPEQDR